jgi:hypothetical protein
VQPARRATETVTRTTNTGARSTYLDAQLEDVVREEAKRNLALAGQVVQVHRVDDLVRRHEDVDHAEVLAQAVPDEQTAGVDEVAQLQVDGLGGRVVEREREREGGGERERARD